MSYLPCHDLGLGSCPVHACKVQNRHTSAFPELAPFRASHDRRVRDNAKALGKVCHWGATFLKYRKIFRYSTAFLRHCRRFIEFMFFFPDLFYRLSPIAATRPKGLPALSPPFGGVERSGRNYLGRFPACRPALTQAAIAEHVLTLGSRPPTRDSASHRNA